ncbi:MAG: hypothetical protein ACMZ7B_03850 [Balneola sp.]
MKILKLFLVLSIIFFISGCKSTFQPGLYGKCESSFLACSQFHFTSDSTFESYTFYDVGGSWGIIDGYYTMNSDTLVLNSYYQPQKPTVEYSPQLSTSTDDIVQITVNEYDGAPLVGANVIINSEDKVEHTDEFGLVRIKTDSIGLLRVQWLGLDEKIKIEDPHSSKIDVMLDYPDENFYLDKKLIFRRNRLYFVHENKESKFGFRKVSLSNKKYVAPGS